jgi:hypothetical protein
MAEFDGLDSRLRDAFAKAAEQGDSAGVADAIRSRISAGDSGASVAASTAPGWGGGVGSWLPWIGLIVVAAIGGTAVGASGLVGAPEGSPGSGPSAVVLGTAPAASCPGGPMIDEFHAGDRVLAVQRSEESDYFGVRDPRDLATVLWVPASVLTMDAGQPDPSTLPVGECPEIVISYPTPTPTPEETQEPVPGPSDTTAPKINTATGTPNPLYNVDPLLLQVTAGDGVGVVGVTVSWSGEFTGSANMSLVGSEWRYTFTPPDDGGGDIHFTFRARDAAGNVSGPVMITIDHQYFG